MLQSLNTVPPHVVVSPTIRSFSLLLYNTDFDTVMNCNEDMWHGSCGHLFMKGDEIDISLLNGGKLFWSVEVTLVCF